MYFKINKLCHATSQTTGGLWEGEQHNNNFQQKKLYFAYISVNNKSENI